MNNTVTINREVNDIASSLCGSSDIDVLPIEGGRNSRIYQVKCGEKLFALKFFRPDKEGRRDRFDAETTALTLFASSQLNRTPQIIAKDRDNNCVLMEWIDGDLVEQYGKNEINVLIDFIQNVHDVACRVDDQNIRQATEACLNGDEIIRQIHLRLERLAFSKTEYKALQVYIDEKLIPALDELACWSRKQYEQNELDFSKDISRTQQTLSLVDCGFHNTLRVNNKIFFVDFEFFGWDDPVKLVADTLLHPAMSLTDEAKQQLLSGLVTIFKGDEAFVTRLRALYPLLGFKWCTIMLNCFQSGYKPIGAKGIIDKDQQLLKVENLTESICKHYKDFLK